MNPEDIARRERELREKCPEMFDHPDAMPGEIWFGDYWIDVVPITVRVFRELGIPSARAGSKPVMGKLEGYEGTLEFRPVFMKVEELIVAAEAAESIAGRLNL